MSSHPRRKRKVDHRNDSEGFTMVSDSSAASSLPRTTLPRQPVNVSQWQIDGDRISSTNTVTTPTIDTHILENPHTSAILDD